MNHRKEIISKLTDVGYSILLGESMLCARLNHKRKPYNVVPYSRIIRIEDRSLSM